MIIWSISTFIISTFLSLLFMIQTTVKPIQVIIISSIILLCSFSVNDIKHPSCYSFKPYFVDFWLVCIIFTVSAFIDTETCPRVWLQIVSGTYPNRTYGFVSPAFLWKVVVRVPVFVVAPVSINTLIRFKEVPQVIQVCSCVGKCCPKRHKGTFG